MHRIFINYRREDAEGYAIILQDRLAKHFGEKQLFMDVDNIEPGADFMKAIEKSLSCCEVILVLIGARWLDAKDEAGNRRLDNSNDLLRIEIETALKSNARVIPVLLHGTVMPTADNLPDSLAPLTRLHAIEISSSRRDYDIERLITTLEKMPGLSPVNQPEASSESTAVAPDTPPAPKSKAFKHGLTGAGIAIALLITLSIYDSEEALQSVAVATMPDTPSTTSTPLAAVSNQTSVAVENETQQLPATINLSGTWFDDGGTQFEATQKGNLFIATGFNLFGMATKQIHGRVEGNTLYFTLQDGFVETDGVGTLNEDGEHLDYTLTQGNFSETGQLHLNHTRN